MFGLLIGAMFFGKPEIVLLVGLGSAIPDLDREYGFFSRQAFRDHQIHRALCHNYLFLGLLYLVNPFIALGAFLHTLLDALTTARDRGVEWLYPFSRMVKRAANDEHGKSLETQSSEIYLYQYDPLEFTRKSDRDLREKEHNPWRRTYGPALSGGLLDLGIFVCSFALFVFWMVLVLISTGEPIMFLPNSYQFSFILPFLIGAVGVAINMLVGESDRKKRPEDNKGPTKRHDALFAVTLVMIAISLIIAGVLNYGYVLLVTEKELPLIFAGGLIVLGCAYVIPKLYNRVGFIKERHSVKEKKREESESGDEDPLII
jgi:hypothetical protein